MLIVAGRAEGHQAVKPPTIEPHQPQRLLVDLLMRGAAAKTDDQLPLEDAQEWRVGPLGGLAVQFEGRAQSAVLVVESAEDDGRLSVVSDLVSRFLR